MLGSMELHVKMVMARMGALSGSSGVGFKRRSKGICKWE